MNSIDYIRDRLFALQDTAYRDFTAALIPGADNIIGVRSPALRQLAKELSDSKHAQRLVHTLPHRYLEEYNLHSFLISRERDFDACIREVEALLPYVDNWAVCDSLSPSVFRRQAPRLLPYIERWVHSDHTYTVRFGILCLMRYFLDDRFDSRYCDMVAQVHSDEYYVNMMRAWYFATALAKQYDAVLPYIESRQLDRWTHNKAIQKSIESRRISDDRKAYLRTLKIK